jgi:hypothetical protein
VNEIKLYLRTLLSSHDNKENAASVIAGDNEYVDHVVNTPLSADHYSVLKKYVRYIGVTRSFREVIDFFKTPSGETPAGFKIEYELSENDLHEHG